jgi:integrase
MFDARAAKALQSGQHIVIEAAPGLRLVASASARAWVYRYRSPVDGRMRQIRIGRWPQTGLPAALAAWERLKQERDAGADPAAEKRQRRQDASAQARQATYTVRRACDEYLQRYRATVTPKTYTEAERLLLLELGAIEDRPAAGITRADAFDLLDGMRDRPVLAGRVRQLMGAVWDRALDAGRIAPDVPNWWRLVLRGKLPSRGKIVGGEHQGEAKRVLSEGELQLLLPWMPNFSRDVEDALTLTLWTCCRGAEIVAAERAEITDEPDGLWWTVPKAKLKMRRNPLTVDLRVPLIGRAAALVRRRLEASRGSMLFPSRGASGHIEQKALGVAVWTHMPRCDLRPEWVRPRLPVAAWAPHDLRRTGRTLLASMGCPAEIAEAILGHLLPGVQGVYDRYGYDAERRLWLTRLADRLEQLAVQGPAPGR